jgi:hypothetical protein
MPYTIPLACPGRCNKSWRDAEATGQPHDLTPTWGEPLWCSKCTYAFACAVTDFPRLVVAIHQQALHGTPVPNVSTVRATPKAVHAWPGQASRLITEEIREALTALEDDVRQHRRLRSRVVQKREGVTITNAARFVVRHLDWIVTQHPIADDPEDAPAAYLLRLHSQAERFASEAPPRVERKPTPCPVCGALSLVEQPGGQYIECQIPGCEQLFKPSEYEEHTRAAAEKANAEWEQWIAATAISMRVA